MNGVFSCSFHALECVNCVFRCFVSCRHHASQCAELSSVTADLNLRTVRHAQLRIPEDGKDYPLPPSLGLFPIVAVSDFKDKVALSAARCAVLYSAVLCCAVPCCSVLCRAVRCCVVLCCAVLCCALRSS